MATGAKNSLGTVFSIESELAGIYIAIEEIIDLPGILGDKTGKIDVTSIDSVGYKEYIADALKDAPEVSFKCNFVESALGQTRVKLLAGTGATTSFKLVLSNKVATSGTTITRAGYITSRAITAGKGSQLILEFSVQFSGAPVETVAV